MSVGSYYSEPDGLSISIHGAKLGGEYTGTHQGGVAGRAELHPGIRLPDPALARNPPVGIGRGDVPATPTAPAFTINGFTDLSFDQHEGWALRAGARCQVIRQWSVEPFCVRWNVSDSPVSRGIASFTVNTVAAQQQFGAYEPRNVTSEFGVTVGFRF